MDFKESGFMYAVGIFIVAFVIFQSMFFLIRAWRRGKEAGLSVRDMKNAVTSSALFTIAPAIAILATVITLAGTLGLVLPWIRLTVIGNLQYEVTAAKAAMESFAASGAAFGNSIEDPKIFAAVAWVMTVGSAFPLVLLPIFLKKIQSKIGKVTSGGGDSKFGDIVSAATFIGLIAAFIGTAVAGTASTIEVGGEKQAVSMGAGVMSVAVLLTSIIVLMVLQWLCKKFKLDKFETFVLPIAMFAGMGMAILLYNVLPADIALLEWRPVV